MRDDDDMLTCPCCGSADVMHIGLLPDILGMIKLNTPGFLKQCLRCKLFFRHPYLDEESLAEAYADISSSDTWVYEDRTDFRLARQSIFQHCSEGKVLDVGCFRGDFLASLPNSYECYGIEPSPDARKVAEEKGIRLLGETIGNTVGQQPIFDVISMLDVIEHIPQPLHALQALKGWLKPGGIIIIATGNANALPWKLMRLNYWYYFPEHVSFVQPCWFRWIENSLGMQLLGVKKFSHFEQNIWVRFRQFVEVLSYITVSSCRSQSLLYCMLKYIYPFSRAVHWTSPPKTSSWKDHMLVVLKFVK